MISKVMAISGSSRVIMNALLDGRDVVSAYVPAYGPQHYAFMTKKRSYHHNAYESVDLQEERGNWTSDGVVITEHRSGQECGREPEGITM
jgi:hypothetical protein